MSKVAQQLVPYSATAENGSNKDGFAPIDLAFIQSYQNTPSTVTAGEGGIGLSIEWDDTGELCA